MKAATKSLSRSLCLLGALSAVAPVWAADLTLTWRANDDDATAGYLVEVRDPHGALLRSVDARDKTRLVLRDLDDNQLMFIAVRPYDVGGNQARKASDPLVTFANPRVDRLDGSVELGRRFKLTLYGANFADEARVASKRPGVVVTSTTVLRPDAAIIEVSLRSDRAQPLSASDFTVANPVRRAAEYLEAHPELLDVDGSGTVDAADLARVDAAFGTRTVDAGSDAQLDLNADGVIDAEDAAQVRRFLNHAASGSPVARGAP